MKNFMYLISLFCFLNTAMSQNLTTSNFQRSLDLADNLNSLSKDASSSRTFDALPDSIRYNVYGGGSINYSFKYILTYDNGRISSMDVENGWTIERVKFKYDDHGRRKVADEYTVVGSDEYKQGYVYYHYDPTGRLDKCQYVNSGDILSTDSVQVEYQNGKVIRYNRLGYNNNNHTWRSVYDLYDIQYDGDKILAYETLEFNSTTGKYNRFKNENLEALDLQTVNLFPELGSLKNFDTTNIKHVLLSPKNASDFLLDYHQGHDVYRYDETLSEFVLIEKSRILANGKTSVVNIYDLDNTDQINAVITYSFDDDNKLVKKFTDNKINDLTSQNLFAYNNRGFLNLGVYLDDNLDSLSINEYKYTWYDDGKLFKYVTSERYQSWVNSAEEYLFYYNTLSGSKSKAVSFSVNPNPSSDLIYFDVPSAIISASVINANGQITSVIPGNGNLNISHLSPGSYVLKLVTKSGVNIARFIKA